MAPAAARAVLPAGPASVINLDVDDVGGFDPIVRRNAGGGVARHNLSFRTTQRDAERIRSLLTDMRNQTVAEFGLRWATPSGPQTLRMFNAYLLQFTYVDLWEGGRGRPYEEFAVAIESTHGSLRRSEAQQTLVADYKVTPRGVEWIRSTT
ncbi:MAG: hypothetical protein FJX64_05670 [Alphaproteobacteria bacterium]|nr:hypothetical protein [Alphaproteobacteria bacterium]